MSGKAALHGGDTCLWEANTHGKLDHKEGMYFGPEQSADHCHASMPLHGKNQFPDEAIADMRAAILTYIDQVTELGKTICDAFSLSLGLECHFIRGNYLQPEPIALFRCFKYSLCPRAEAATGPEWGIREHTGMMSVTSVKLNTILIVLKQILGS